MLGEFLSDRLAFVDVINDSLDLCIFVSLLGEGVMKFGLCYV